MKGQETQAQQTALTNELRQQEYSELLRRYRQLLNEKKLLEDEMQGTFKQQSSMLTRLQKQNLELSNETSMCDQQMAKLSKKQTEASKNVEVQKTELDEIKQKVYKENQVQKDMDEAIKMVNSEIIEMKRKTVGSAVASGHERASTFSKQAKIIENRVDKANVRYSESLNKNKGIREQIDGMRRERVVFEQIFNKLEKDLGVKRKNMSNLVTEVSKSLSEKDKLSEQMSKKISSKGPASLTKMKNEGSQSVKESKEKQEQTALRKRLIRQAEKQYKQSGGIFYTADELAEKFIQQEQENFKLFNSVNKLNKEVIRTETEVFDFQGELDKLERKNIATGDNDVADGKLHAIKELEKEQNKTEDELYEVQEEASQLRKEFKTIGSIINKIVTETLKIDLDNEFGGSIPKNNRTGDYEITEDNLLQALGSIEQRVSEINVLKQETNQIAPQAFPSSEGGAFKDGKISFNPAEVEDFGNGSDSDDDIQAMGFDAFRKQMENKMKSGF